MGSEHSSSVVIIGGKAWGSRKKGLAVRGRVWSRVAAGLGGAGEVRPGVCASASLAALMLCPHVFCLW